MGGYSIYGASLDGVDPCLRMEGLMADEMGGKDGWKIEKCFLIEDSREVADIIHGDFFIARSNVADEKYSSLSGEQLLKYKRLFGILSDSTKPHTGLRSSRSSPTGRTKNDKYQENTGQPDRSALA